MEAPVDVRLLDGEISDSMEARGQLITSQVICRLLVEQLHHFEIYIVVCSLHFQSPACFDRFCLHIEDAKSTSVVYIECVEGKKAHF